MAWRLYANVSESGAANSILYTINHYVMGRILRNQKFSTLLSCSILLLLFQQPFSVRAQSPVFSAFTIDSDNNTGKIHETIVCDVNNAGTVIGVISSGIDLSDLVPTFSTNADSVLVNGVKQESTQTAVDFSSPVTYTLYAGESGVSEYTVNLVQTGLPVIYVNTVDEAPIESKDDYVSGRVSVITADGSIDLEAETQIRGRGNSTWGMPKKPYRLRLRTGASVFGYPTDRDWVLLANYSDKTLARTTLAFTLGEEFGLAYNNRTQPVDLVINGVYQGSYLFGEHVKVAPGRVNVTELSEDDEDESVITGGYFLEIDARLDEDFWFFTPRGVPITIKSPGDITTAQLDYISSYVSEMEDVLFSASFSDTENGYQKFIDSESFIRWFWVNEVFKNHDAKSFSSIFLYKERDEKLKMGPLWDFDLSAGNINYANAEDPTGWWVKTGPWFARLFEDPAFRNAAETFWNTHRDEVKDILLTWLDEHAALIGRSQDQNFRKWPILDTYVWPNAVVTGSYEGEINYLKEWLTTRIDWINAQVGPEDSKISPYLTVDAPAPMFAGTVLSVEQLNATATALDTEVPGTFSYTPPAGTVLSAGPDQELQVTFTPDDQVVYNAVSTTVIFDVLAAGEGFYRAININGPELVIDGNTWEASGSARGFSAASGSWFSAPTVTLSPEVDAERAQMIRSGLWGNNIEVSLSSVPAGVYNIYVYVWEDNAPEVFSLNVQGVEVETNINSGAAGSWQRLGPYLVTIDDGSLNVTTTGGVANLSGLKIWTVQSAVVSTQDEYTHAGANESPALSAYPNPFTDVITVTFTGRESSTAQLVVIDSHGREVHQVIHEGVSKGRTEAVQLRAGDIPNGVYLLKLKNGSHTHHIRVSLMR